MKDAAKTKNKYPPRIVVHGAQKVGKSSFFAGAPKPIFVRTEDGLNGIDTNAFPLCQTLSDVGEQLNLILNEDHDYKTLVIDSADWLEKLIHSYVCSIEGITNIAKASGGFGKGYIDANNHWRKILDMLDEINKRRLMYIGVICHSRIFTFNDPESEPYDVYKMKLHSPKSGDGSCEMLAEWGDIIGFAQKEVFVKQKESGHNDNPSFQAVSTGSHFLNLEGTAAFLAGNRYGIKGRVPLNWIDFHNAFVASGNSK